MLIKSASKAAEDMISIQIMSAMRALSCGLFVCGSIFCRKSLHGSLHGSILGLCGSILGLNSNCVARWRDVLVVLGSLGPRLSVSGANLEHNWSVFSLKGTQPLVKTVDLRTLSVKEMLDSVVVFFNAFVKAL